MSYDQAEFGEATYKQNRKQRRTEASFLRREGSENHKRKVRMGQRKTQELIEAARQKRLAGIRSRTALRTKLRKEIAEKEGVSVRRVVLMPPKVERVKERIATHYFEKGKKVTRTRLVGKPRGKYTLPSDVPYVIKGSKKQKQGVYRQQTRLQRAAKYARKIARINQ